MVARTPQPRAHLARKKRLKGELPIDQPVRDDDRLTSNGRRHAAREDVELVGGRYHPHNDHGTRKQGYSLGNEERHFARDDLRPARIGH